MLGRIRAQERIGTKGDYHAWTLAVGGVDRAWVFPLYGGEAGVVAVFITVPAVAGNPQASAAITRRGKAALYAKRIPPAPCCACLPQPCCPWRNAGYHHTLYQTSARRCAHRVNKGFPHPAQARHCALQRNLKHFCPRGGACFTEPYSAQRNHATRRWDAARAGRIHLGGCEWLIPKNTLKGC